VLNHTYRSVNEVPVITWAAQGSLYDDLRAAKFAAAKLFCNVSAVYVKQISARQWTLMYWR
jgi:hypothetical protein